MPRNARVRSNRVVFTLNNYTEEDLVAFEEHLLNSTDIVYAIIGQEIGENGTPHLQGFIHVDAKPKQCGILYWRNRLPGGQRCHFENAHGSDEDSRGYCSKDGPYIEVGTPAQPKGRYEKISEAASIGLEAIEEVDPEFFCKNFFQARAIVEYKRSSQKAPPLTVELRPWQKSALEKLHAQNDRRILFVVDEEGGKGKTILAAYISRNLGGYRCGGGKHADLAHMWAKSPRDGGIVAIDLTRTIDKDYWPYHFMEDLKNGFITSTKYSGEAIDFPSQKVIVFTNQYPDKSRLSADRYEIMILSSNNLFHLE